MQLIEAFRLALQSLWTNKLRSILTLLGVIIGVSSVITVVTLTDGARQFVTSKINSYGAAVITISKMPQTLWPVTAKKWHPCAGATAGVAPRPRFVRRSAPRRPS